MMFGAAIWRFDFIKTAALFFFLYNLSLSAFPSLSTARVSLIFIVFVLFLQGRLSIKAMFSRIQPVLFIFLSVVFICFAYSFFLLSLGSYSEVDSIQFSRIFHFYLYSVLGAYLFCILAKFDLDRVLRWFFVASSAQAVFIIVSYLSPEFRALMSSVLVQGGNVDLESVVRASGLSNGLGSALSLIQGLGCISGAVLLSRKPSFFDGVLMLIAFLLLLISTMLSGRVGLFIGMATSVLVFARLEKYLILFLFILISLISYIIVSAFDSLPFAERTFNWAFEYFVAGESASVADLSTMEVPRLTLETFLGVGRVSLADGGNASGHDSGYVQTYYSLGLFFAAVFYLSFIIFFLWSSWRLRSIELFLLVVLAAIIEVKEPFIFKYILPFFMFIFYFCLGVKRV